MNTEDTDNGTLEHWTPQDVADGMADQRIILIDVRTPQEFSFERIRGALLSPMQELDPRNLPGHGNGQTVVFHCGSGVRSRKMAEKALATGWAKAAHMEGGFGHWKESGQPYIGTDMGSGAPKEMKKA